MSKFRLKSIRLKNWISYYGIKDFNFSQNKGKNSYIIYGEDSRGKTAFFESFQYAFFGRVLKRKKTSDIERNYKPLFSEKKKNEPLMNVDALKEYRENNNVKDCVFSVRFEFQWNDNSYTLIRGARDKGALFTPEEFVDLIPDGGGSLHERDRIEILHKIIPKQLKDFFLVDGEYMERYRELIASDDTSMKDKLIRNQIEQIIGMPVLKVPKEIDFPEIRATLTKKHKDLAKVNADAKKAYQNLEAIRYDIKSITDVLKNTREDYNKQKVVRDELWDWIVAHKTDSQLAEEFTTNKEEIDRLTSERGKILLERRESLSKDENGTWLSILQPHLLQLMKDAKISNDKISNLQTEKSKLQGRLEEKYSILKNKDNGICETCTQPISLSQEQSDIIEKQTLSIEEEIKILTHDIKTLDGNAASINSNWAITRFGDGGNLSTVVKIEADLKQKTSKLRAVLTKQKKLSKLIEGGTVSNFNKKKMEYDTADNTCTMILSAITELQDDLIELKKQERIAEEASDLGDTEKGFKISQQLKYIHFLQDIWGGAISKYEAIKRKETEKIASESFMQMTNNPQGFRGLELADGFGLRIIDHEGEEHPGSPGAWSVVAISMIHALSECSNISFPLIIDTPLRSIGKGHFEEVSDFLFGTNRTVILLPNYLVNMDETDKRLKTNLSASWDVGWGDSKYPQFEGCEINKTHVLQRVGDS